MPVVIDDHPVKRGNRKDHPEGRALRQDRGGQGPLLIGKPLEDGMQGNRRRRPFTGTENHAADQQRREADGADHRKLRNRPDRRQHQQNPARLDTVGDEADHDGRDRIEEEERGAEQPELLGVELQVGHDRSAGKTDHDLVREIHEHEQKQHKRDLPGALGRRLRSHVGSFRLFACPLIACLVVGGPFEGRFHAIDRTGDSATPGFSLTFVLRCTMATVLLRAWENRYTRCANAALRVRIMQTGKEPC